MSNFTVIEIIDSETIKVSPSWQLTYKDGTTFRGDTVKIRGLEHGDNPTVKSRLERLLLDVRNDINFKSPEIIDSRDQKNAVVSCSVYLAKTNILYYFPEYVPSF